MSEENLVKFSPFSSHVDPSFWHKLSQLKLDVDKLSENTRSIWGSYSNVNSFTSTSLHVDCMSFNSEFEALQNLLPATGRHLNVNTLESFKNYDKNKLLEGQGSLLWSEITNGSALENPSLLARFFLLTFGDLKKYVFYYWFAFLAPNSSVAEIVHPPVLLSEKFSANQIKSLETAWCNILDVRQKGFFIIKVEEEIEIFPLTQVQHLYNDNSDLKKLYLVFADPCPLGNYPGWPLRNLLSLFLHYCPHIAGKDIQVLCLRFGIKPQSAHISADNSLVIVLKAHLSTEPKIWIGWERNNRGKFGPRFVNVSTTMDPVKVTTLTPRDASGPVPIMKPSCLIQSLKSYSDHN